MTNIPLFQAVKYVAAAASLEVSWVGKAIVLSSKSANESSENSDGRKPQPSKAGVRAHVNDVAITIDQVNAVAGKRENEVRQKFTGEERERQIAEARKQALDDLINRERLLQEFRSRGFSVSEMLIDEHIQEIIETRFSGDRATFLSQLEG